MSACDSFIQRVSQMLPDQCTVEDLVKAGIYRSPQAAAHARSLGDCPDYFKLGRRIMYPKEGVIKYLDINKHENRKASPLCEIAKKIQNVSEQSGVAYCCRA